MTLTNASVGIVGAGLSGLVAAWLLEQQGVQNILLFEARDTVGGRILSVDASGVAVDQRLPATDRFDLGPTWFWPDFQPQLDQLIDALQLPRFAQHEDGDVLIERSPHASPVRMQGYASSPSSMRLVGGTGSLVNALHNRLRHTRILLGHAVSRLRREASHVEILTQDTAGHEKLWPVTHVFLALPPRLTEHRIEFDPPLPAELIQSWRATPTWMAPHAKYLAIYEAPFWRAKGLSGAARSTVGPMVEIHDVSMPDGHAALFGFIGVPAAARQGLSDTALRAHCRAQLGRLFGAQAAAPVADALKDWAQDPCTATEEDQLATGHHSEAPPSRAISGPWRTVLTGIGSEWSTQFPGYLAGAVDAAWAGVESWRTCVSRNHGVAAVDQRASHLASSGVGEQAPRTRQG